MGAATVDHQCVKTKDQPVAAGHSIDSARWQDTFEALMGRIAGRFARVEPRRRAREFVLGLLSDLPRKKLDARRARRGQNPLWPAALVVTGEVGRRRGP